MLPRRELEKLIAKRSRVEPWAARRLMRLHVWQLAACGFDPSYFTFGHFLRIIQSMGPDVPAMDDQAWHCIAAGLGGCPVPLEGGSVFLNAVSLTAKRKGWSEGARLMEIEDDWRRRPFSHWYMNECISELAEFLGALMGEMNWRVFGDVAGIPNVIRALEQLFMHADLAQVMQHANHFVNAKVSMSRGVPSGWAYPSAIHPLFEEGSKLKTGHVVTQLCDKSELQRVARKMSNCVLTYLDRVLAKECLLASIFDLRTASEATVEVVADKGTKTWRLVEAKGRDNESIDSVMEAGVASFMRFLDDLVVQAPGEVEAYFAPQTNPVRVSAIDWNHLDRRQEALWGPCIPGGARHGFTTRLLRAMESVSAKAITPRE